MDGARVDGQPAWGEEQDLPIGGHSQVSRDNPGYLAPFRRWCLNVRSPLVRHLVHSVGIQTERNRVEGAVDEERRPSEGIPEDAGKGGPDGEHASQRHQLEDGDDAAAELLVVGGLLGDETQRRRHGRGRGTTLQQASNE